MKRPNRNARLAALRLAMHDAVCTGAGNHCVGAVRDDHARRTMHARAVRLADADDPLTEARKVVHEVAHPRCPDVLALHHVPADHKGSLRLAAMVTETVGGRG